MDEGTSTILSDVLRTTPLAVTAGLPSTEALLQTIRRETKPIQLDHNGRLPFMLRETDHGEDFLLYEDDSMIIFTCEKIYQYYRNVHTNLSMERSACVY